MKSIGITPLHSHPHSHSHSHSNKYPNSKSNTHTSVIADADSRAQFYAHRNARIHLCLGHFQFQRKLAAVRDAWEYPNL